MKKTPHSTLVSITRFCCWQVYSVHYTQLGGRGLSELSNQGWWSQCWG